MEHTDDLDTLQAIHIGEVMDEIPSIQLEGDGTPPLSIVADGETPQLSIVADGETPQLSIVADGETSPLSFAVDDGQSVGSQELDSISVISDETENLSYSSDDDDEYIKKFDESTRTNIIEHYHKEMKYSNYDEISALTKVVRDEAGNVIDPVHTTMSFLTKFERAKVLGLRAKQINNGSEPFVTVPDNVIEGHLIAEMELQQKTIPYIISRPLPGGKNEYWKLSDLELIDY